MFSTCTYFLILRCDQYVDFSELRNTFVWHAEHEPENPGAIHRIRNYDQDDCDQARGVQALLH
jgi:hypothetical protein